MPGKPINWYKAVERKADTGWVLPLEQIMFSCRTLLPLARRFGNRDIKLTLAEPGTYRFAVRGSAGIIHSNEFVVE